MPGKFLTVLCATIILLAALAVGCDPAPQQSSSADVSKATSSTPNSKVDQANQIFELRIYTAAPGKMEALHKRFQDHTLRLFDKHGIKSIGYWTAADNEEAERLYYMVAYPDRAAREKRLIQGIAVDPEFLQAVAESEKDGKLTTKTESILLTPTDYSALK
tara:strand:+ start:201 stop:683 length:483 start_codon:yes stop_codon:yes gene_type:complete